MLGRPEWASNPEEIIAEVPSVYCVVRKDDPPEEQRRVTNEWLANVLRYEAFWAERDRFRDSPALIRAWCRKCGKRHIYDINRDGEIAMCQSCGNEVALRLGQ